MLTAIFSHWENYNSVYETIGCALHHIHYFDRLGKENDVAYYDTPQIYDGMSIHKNTHPLFATFNCVL